MFCLLLFFAGANTQFNFTLKFYIQIKQLCKCCLNGKSALPLRTSVNHSCLRKGQTSPLHLPILTPPPTRSVNEYWILYHLPIYIMNTCSAKNTCIIASWFTLRVVEDRTDIMSPHPPSQGILTLVIFSLKYPFKTYQ